MYGRRTDYKRGMGTSNASGSDVPDFKTISGKKYRSVSRHLQSKPDANVEAGLYRNHYKGYDVSIRVVEVKKGKYAVYKHDSR